MSEVTKGAAVSQLEKRRAFLTTAVEAANKAIAECEEEFVATRDTLKEQISKDEIDIADINAALNLLQNSTEKAE